MRVVRAILKLGLVVMLGSPLFGASLAEVSSPVAGISKGSLIPLSICGTFGGSHRDTFSRAFIIPSAQVSPVECGALANYELRRTMSTGDLAPAKAVLQYLQEMIELCRKFHRQDLVDNYTDAWELAALKIYGPLPERLPARGYYAQPTPKQAPDAPPWKREMLAKPYRKIVARFSVVEDGLSIDYEQLECGHRLLAGIDPPGSPQAKRRRCDECARGVAKKSVESESAAPKRSKGATA